MICSAGKWLAQKGQTGDYNAISESNHICDCEWIRRRGGTGFADVRGAYVFDVEYTGDPSYRERQAVQQLPCGFAAEQV